MNKTIATTNKQNTPMFNRKWITAHQLLLRRKTSRGMNMAVFIANNFFSFSSRLDEEMESYI